MKKIAFAQLLRQTGRPHQCTVELVELDLPESSAARFTVTVRQGKLQGGVVMDAAESSLTAAPARREEAERRAVDFVRRRVASGESLVRHDGFPALAATADLPAPVTPTAAPVAAESTVPPQVAALVARFHPDRWKLETSQRQARSVWRVAECSDAASPGAAQHALVAMVPRLVSLIESGDDLLDHCLAVAIARLGDPGAGPAMHALSERGRSPATRRVAHQAWLLLQPPQARAAHADTLLPGQQSVLATVPCDEPALAAIGQSLAQASLGWAQGLADWYDIALARPEARAGLLAVLQVLPLKPGTFQAVRHVYKAAELRRDAEVVALLHARFENTPSYFYNHSLSVRRGFADPTTGRWVKTPPAQELARPDARLAYTSRTRNYLRLRGWRQLRRLAALRHSHAPELAVQMLLALDDRDLPPAREESRHGSNGWTKRHYPVGATWLLVRHLLLGRHPDIELTPRSLRWHSPQPLHTGTAMHRRNEGLPELWDRHPQALVVLALKSRAALVHAVVARMLQDHLAVLETQDTGTLKALLQSRYAPTARVAFEAVRARLERAGGDPVERIVWLRLLVQSTDPVARDFAFQQIAADPAGCARHADLVACLLLSEHGPARLQGMGLASMADAAALVAELQAALLAVDAEAPALAEVAGTLETLFDGALAEAARQAPVEPLLCLLDHPATAILNLAVDWLLRITHGAAWVPPATLARLLAEPDLDRRAAGVRLLSSLSDEVLRSQAGLLGDLALHPHAGMRAAVAPALRRLAAGDAAFARTLAERLHAALFMAEPGDGVHDDILRWLTTPGTGLDAPARDPASLWRALQARSSGAQRYGAWGLMDMPASAYTLRQQAVLAQHADVRVRAWALQALDLTLGPLPSPEQAAQLLPLADTAFDDARAHAHALFAERLPDSALTTELLIAWIDHPAPWVQALGRQRLVRRMDAAEASLCLARLSQHPGTQVQLFVTQWLLEMPLDDLPAVAQRLRALKPYFLTVLSQVHRGRVAKSRVTEFLRGLTGHPDTATVVAEIFARQVVTASLTDKPQYIAGLRDIAARHPQIELPFLRWTTPPTHAEAPR